MNGGVVMNSILNVRSGVKVALVATDTQAKSRRILVHPNRRLMLTPFLYRRRRGRAWPSCWPAVWWLLSMSQLKLHHQTVVHGDRRLPPAAHSPLASPRPSAHSPWAVADEFAQRGLV